MPIVSIHWPGARGRIRYNAVPEGLRGLVHPSAWKDASESSLSPCEHELKRNLVAPIGVGRGGVGRDNSSRRPPTRKGSDLRQCGQSGNTSRSQRRSRRLACLLLIMTAEKRFFVFCERLMEEAGASL